MGGGAPGGRGCVVGFLHAVTVGASPVPARGDPAPVGLRSSSSFLFSFMSVVLLTGVRMVATKFLFLIRVMATRRAGPVRMPRWSARPGWGREEEGRRLAVAGLGSTAAAWELALPVGRRSPCNAALRAATAGSTRERPLEWWVLRGSPDVVARPPSWVAASITIRRREDFWSTSSLSSGVPSVSVPLLRLSIGITGGGTTGRGGIVTAHVLSMMGLVTPVVDAAAVTSSWMPPPPPPSPVVGWVGQATTLPPASATATGRPLEEAAGGTGRGGHPPAAATAGL